jgi:pantoate--beta-alanine ligase
MLIARSPEDFQLGAQLWRMRNRRVAFVPTMGALHEGHLALVRRARELGECVAASIFVNPTQFGPGEDFSRYPRQPERDIALLEGAGCDLLFLPDVEIMFSGHHATFVTPGGAAVGLEGESRPGHFRGVATVVAQLFLIVQPQVAVFGEKDAQQLAVIRQMVRDLHFPVTIVGHPTVREADGLAMSSRNALLDPHERAAATVLIRALRNAEDAIGSGQRAARVIKELMLDTLRTEPLCQTDYAEVVDATDFQPVERLRGRVVLPVAARFGATRLLDNLQLNLPT